VNGHSPLLALLLVAVLLATAFSIWRAIVNR
jgi:hypothetical protein